VGNDTMAEIIGLKKFLVMVRQQGSFPVGYYRCRQADLNLKLTAAQQRARNKKKEKPAAPLPSYYQPVSPAVIAAAQAAAAAQQAAAAAAMGTSSFSRVRSHDQIGASAQQPTAKRARDNKMGMHTDPLAAAIHDTQLVQCVMDYRWSLGTKCKPTATRTCKL
jgi:hypothetical protein